MEYQIIGKVTDTLLLMAYENPNDKFYIHTDKEDAEISEMTEDANNGKKYILPNIIFEYPDKHRDAVLCDTDSLSIEQVDLLNEYLEKDERAWISHLYCDELKQLIDYEPFLGNKQCDILETKLYEENEKTLIIKDVYSIFYSALNEILKDENSTLVILGNYQNFVHNKKIKVYNITEDKETDLKNLELLMHSYKHVYIINDISGLYTKYQIDLLNELKIDNKIKLTSKLNFSAEGDNLIKSDGLRFMDNWIGQYSICQLGEEYFNLSSSMIATISREYVEEENKEVSGFMSPKEYEIKRMEFAEKMLGKDGELMRRHYGIKS
jgi:hypothetical protein